MALATRIGGVERVIAIRWTGSLDVGTSCVDCVATPSTPVASAIGSLFTSVGIFQVLYRSVRWSSCQPSCHRIVSKIEKWRLFAMRNEGKRIDHKNASRGRSSTLRGAVVLGFTGGRLGRCPPDCLCRCNGTNSCETTVDRLPIAH